MRLTLTGDGSTTTTAQLSHLVTTVLLPQTATRQGSRVVTVRVRCAGTAKRACRLTVQGLRKGRRSAAATNRRTVLVQPAQVGTVHAVVTKTLRLHR